MSSKPGREQARQSVEHERARHGHVQAGAGADHRDLDGDVDQLHGVGRDPGVLMTKDDDGPLAGGAQVGQPNRLVGELNPDDSGALFPLPLQPFERVPAGPVHAGGTPQGVALVQCLGYPRQLRHRQARPDCVTGPQQRAEVHTVLGPERSDYQVIPAGMRTPTALALYFPAGGDPCPAYHAGWAVSNRMSTVLSGAPRPSPEKLSPGEPIAAEIHLARARPGLGRLAGWG